MASGLLSPLLSSAGKLLDLLWSSARASYCAPGGEGERRSTFAVDLQRLERLLRRIQATLDDVGEREFQLDKSVKLWVEELTDLARDGEDVLDGYRYEMLRRHFQLKLQGAADDASASPSSRKRNHEEDGSSISERIRKITRRFQISTDRAAMQLIPEEDAAKSERIEVIIHCFEEISRDRAALQLGENDGRRIAERDYEWESRTTSHLFDESLVFGRIDEKERIIGSVLSCSQGTGTQVLPVVGMGGIGKTTLAQMVYNDRRIQKHFSLMGWIHVSETFDLRRLTIAITESLTRESCEYKELSSIHRFLKQKLDGKSVFLVLDDLWNQRQSSWEKFLVPFQFAERVTIIVTTRSNEVARLVQSGEPFVLHSLPEEYCWLLFQCFAFGKRIMNEESSLVQVGRKVMQKCGGLPLAVKSIGCLLRSKMDMQTWTEISESDFWEHSEDNEEIFSALRLSFYRLPGRLKPCFLLCALYPKGEPFTKDEMIHLWIAHGYIQTTGSKTLEKVAGEYFGELNERSLIETDLVHLDIRDSHQDLNEPLAISPQSSVAVDEARLYMENEVQHLFFWLGRRKSSRNTQQVRTNNPLRVGRPSIQSVQFADRADSMEDPLNLNCDSIAELPICIGNLTRLRRLQLVQIPRIKKLDHYSFCFRSNNNIHKPTEVIFPALEEIEFDDLCNLQDWCGLQDSDCPKMKSITLRNCYKLRRIPYFGSVRNLIIRKLALPDLQLSAHNEPSQLQTLDIRWCHNLKSLTGLKNLCSLGSLYIAHCPRLIVLCKEKLPFRPQHVLIDDCLGLKEWPVPALPYAREEKKSKQNGAEVRKQSTNREEEQAVPRMVKISDIKWAKEYGVAYIQSFEHICLDICPEQGSELILSPDNWLPPELRLLKFGFESSSGVPPYHPGLSTLIDRLGSGGVPSFHPGLSTLGIGKLEIRGCPKLEALMDLEQLRFLHILVIAECPLLYILHDMKFPPRLESLTVEGCHKILSLPLNISDPSTFTELEELLPVIPESVAVFLCPKLKKWCEIQSIEYLENLPDSP
ncbi:hypothetical protein U9M48_002491 [Paspalum notatum var. saurae]|uniref:Uncharacterized protein n=1 Tax=Paspalum notatum var. saurae TaxID=547442 RepID=A0AAQ3SDI5_PASNO